MLDTSSHTKVADIQVTDDTAGTNTLSLTGADAAVFEVIGTELFLKLRANDARLRDRKASYSVTVNVRRQHCLGQYPGHGRLTHSASAT